MIHQKKFVIILINLDSYLHFQSKFFPNDLNIYVQEFIQGPKEYTIIHLQH